jgi:serine/threonine protein kinase
MEEALRNTSADVNRLAEAMHTQHCIFSSSALQETQQFMRSVLYPVKQVHSLGIAHRDIKPANMLVLKSGELVIGDSAMAVFPTTLHRPATSPVSSPITPVMPRLASGRAAAMLLAAGGTAVRPVQRSPPANPAPLTPISIDPATLTTFFSGEFRDRENAGTHAFTGPEFPFSRSQGSMKSTEFLPGDMWAVGWILLKILSGNKVAWMTESSDKIVLAKSSPQDFWAKHLHRTGAPSTDPAVLSAIDLVRGLLLADPKERLNCAAALAHPFLQS